MENEFCIVSLDDMLYTFQSPYIDDWNRAESDLRNQLKKSIDAAASNKKLIVIARLVREYYPLGHSMDEHVLPLFYKCINYFGITDVYIISDSLYERNFGFPTVYIDFSLLRTYKAIQTNLTNLSWNHLSNKSLLLTGKSVKPNRIFLLSKFYDRKILDTLEWSLFVNETMIKDAKDRLFSHYSSDEFNNFIKTCERNPDDIKMTIEGNSSHYCGFPFDEKLYSNTALSIISETWFFPVDENKAFITEKTWRAIANRHPFIIAGNTNSNDRLKELGFKTFDNYMLNSEYDQNLSSNRRLESVVDNHSHFLKIKDTRYKEIENDIEHNYRFFIDYSKNDFQKLSNLISDLSLKSIFPTAFDLMINFGCE